MSRAKQAEQVIHIGGLGGAKCGGPLGVIWEDEICDARYHELSFTD